MPQTQQQREKILQQLHTAVTSEAVAHLSQLNVADQAKVLSDLTVEKQIQVLQQLAAASLVMEYLNLQQQLAIAEHLALPDLVRVVDGMHSDDFIDLFKLLKPQLQQQLIGQISLTSQTELQQLVGYVEGSAGALMSSNYVTLPEHFTIDEAIQMIRTLSTQQDTLYAMYVVDTNNKLIGVISLREIVQAAPDQRIEHVMSREVITGHVFDDQEEIAKSLAYYDFIALPIVDDDEHLLGIVTYDDAMDILRDEATEDIYKSGAVKPIEQQSIKTAPIFSLYSSRVFWLVILVFGSLLSSFGIAHYEDIIAQHIVLVFFLPLLVGSGGNAGSQSATLMVRAMATGDVEFKDWFSLLGRESLVALCLGATMALAVSILGYVRGDIMVAIVLAISMMGIVMLGCLIGMSLPFILKKLNLDPASASAPLVTSICDATGVVVYLFVASQLLF